MNNKELLGIQVDALSSGKILEQIEKYISKSGDFYHIVSLNPEILVLAEENANFKKVVTSAQMRIVDGVGVLLACKLKGIPVVERFTGVDLMEKVLDMAGRKSIRTLLIGGRPNLADELAKRYSQFYPAGQFRGILGIKNIKNPTPEEEKAVLSIVRDWTPQIILVSFGSPDQELWLQRHQRDFRGIVCAGVGGAFDFVAGTVPRAPKLIRTIGFEWLYRLLVQPWRWRRQLRLLKFIWLVLTDR